MIRDKFTYSISSVAVIYECALSIMYVTYWTTDAFDYHKCCFSKKYEMNGILTSLDINSIKFVDMSIYYNFWSCDFKNDGDLLLLQLLYNHLGV